MVITSKIKWRPPVHVVQISSLVRYGLCNTLSSMAYSLRVLPSLELSNTNIPVYIHITNQEAEQKTFLLQGDQKASRDDPKG